MQLIPIIQHEGKPSVLARDLYIFLGLDTANYSRWAKSNIVENPYAARWDDWELFFTIEENPAGGRPSTDYLLSSGFAKKLAMMSKSERGEQARDYFLECERLAQNSAIPALPSYAEALRQLADKVEENDRLQLEAVTNAPKVEFAEKVEQSPDTMNIGAFAKSIGWGQNRLFQELRARRILFYRDGKNIPMQEHLEAGRFKVAQVPKDGRLFPVTTVTGKGMVWLTALLKANQ
jgi:anti-repressor protein